MDRKIEAELLIEQNFPAEGMTTKERDFCIELISNCKDIKDPENIDSIEPGKLIEMYFRKENNEILFNGSVHYILEKTTENRCIEGVIFKHHDNICIDTKVTRLKNLDGKKEYTMLDEFIVKDGWIVSHKSSYNYELSKDYEDEIKINLGGIKK